MRDGATVTRETGRPPLRVALLAGLILLSSLIYLVARWASPSDGSKIILEALPDRRGSLVLEPLHPESPFREGDVALGFDGRSVQDWLVDSLNPSAGSPSLEKGQVLAMTVLRGGREVQLGAPLGSFPLGREVLQRWSLYFFLVYLEVVSIVVFLRRPRLPVAQAFLLLSTAIFSSGLIFFLGLQISDLLRPWLLALWVWGAIILYGLLTGGLLHFAFIFPRGELPAGRRRLSLLAIYGGVWLPYFLLVLLEIGSDLSPVEVLLQTSRGTAVMTLAYFPLVMIASGLRYRRARSEVQRRQMRWIVWALVVANVPWLLLTAAPAVLGDASHLANSLTGLLWCAIPTAFAISILREGLFDIDVIIRRTLVYTVLSAILAAAYFGVVTTLQGVFTATSGQESPVAIVVSTLVIAALFNPLRSRVQEAIDRRFFRRKYNARLTLAAFAATARDEVNLERLVETLVLTVQEALQPESVSLWLRDQEEKT